MPYYLLPVVGLWREPIRRKRYDLHCATLGEQFDTLAGWIGEDLVCEHDPATIGEDFDGAAIHQDVQIHNPSAG
jgi:hypothetical protein